MIDYSLLLCLFLSLPLIQIPEELLLSNGDHVEVYYSDSNVFGDPWKPEWIRCVVDNDKFQWTKNNNYFNKDWAIKHYYWRRCNKPNTIIKPKILRN